MNGYSRAFLFFIFCNLLLGGYPVFGQVVVDDVVLKFAEERDIPSLTSGVIQTSFFREGSLVKRGQLLVELGKDHAQLAYNKTQQELKMAQKDANSMVEIEFMIQSIEVARAELSRALNSNMRLPGAVPQSEIDQLSLIVKKSNSEKKESEFQQEMKKDLAKVRRLDLDQAERNLKDHDIVAPIDGVVIEVFKKAGEWVERSEKIARVVSLSKLRAEVSVPSEIALKNLEGAKCKYVPRAAVFDSKEFNGRVVFVDPEANPINNKMRVWVEVDNSSLKLVAGLTGHVEIIVPKSQPTLTNEKYQTR